MTNVPLQHQLSLRRATVIAAPGFSGAAGIGPGAMPSRVHGCGWSGPVRGAGAADRVASFVLNLDLSLTHGVRHGLGALLGFLPDDNLFRDPGFLGDHRLLAPLLGLN